MYKILVVNASDETDICFSKEYTSIDGANKYYNAMKDMMISLKNEVYREADEILHKVELKYNQIILYMLENEEEIRKFKIK